MSHIVTHSPHFVKARLRLGAQSSYVVKYFEGSNAVNAELDNNTPFFGCTLLSSLEHLILVHLIMNEKDIL